MSVAPNQMSEQRRKRITLYKKIIVIFIISMILLPTLLSIVLFIRLNLVENELKSLHKAMDAISATEPSVHQRPENPTNPTQIPSESMTQSEEYQTTGENLLPTDGADVTTDPVTEEETAEPETAENFTEAPTMSEQEQIAIALAQGRKVVYLTFDDGPCSNTNNLLDVLDRYQVKATFFVNYHENLEEEYKRILADGHTLAMHTYSHVYDSVYKDRDSFISEVNRLRDYLTNLLGYRPNLFRFPGGSSNSVTHVPVAQLITYLNEENIVFYDWNVSSGDGGNVPTSKGIYDNVMSGIMSHDVSVVLMHDSTDKMTTFEAVDDIIETLQSMNAMILPITLDSTPVHHNINH